MMQRLVLLAGLCGAFVSLPRPSRTASLRRAAVAEPQAAAPQTLPYHFREQWYAVGFVADLPSSVNDAPAAYSVFDEPIVLWHDGIALRAAADRCPHRLAALSEGGVEPDGSLRCFYHGWSFDGSGECTAMPQLPKGKAIPRAACVRPYALEVREGIVFIWCADGLPTKDPPASPDDLDANAGDFDVYDFVVELPYDHSYLVENLADPAHIPISHDRTPGGGKRENAEAYVMEVDEATSDGFRGRFRPESKPADSEKSWQDLIFEAPGVVRYRGTPIENFVFGGALHCMPLGVGRSRLLFRTYYSSRGGIPRVARWILALKPTWARHLNSCKILEQDIKLVTSQEDHLARSDSTFADEKLLTLPSSDAYVLAYRKWLDRVGHGMPHHVGWTSSTAPRGETTHVSRPGHRSDTSRFERHVRHSKTSKAASRRAEGVRRAGAIAFVGLAATASLWPPQYRVAASTAALLSAATSAAANKACGAFRTNYVRHA